MTAAELKFTSSKLSNIPNDAMKFANIAEGLHPNLNNGKDH